MHVSRYWINPKWKVNTKLTWTLRRASFIADKFASEHHFVHYCSQMFRKLEKGHRIQNLSKDFGWEDLASGLTLLYHGSGR